MRHPPLHLGLPVLRSALALLPWPAFVRQQRYCSRILGAEGCCAHSFHGSCFRRCASLYQDPTNQPVGYSSFSNDNCLDSMKSYAQVRTPPVAKGKAQSSLFLLSSLPFSGKWCPETREADGCGVMLGV